MPRRPLQKSYTAVRNAVWQYYKHHGRHELPWRKTTNPYRILVSEVMLQQTQVVRVISKYRAWMRQFPTVRSLAEASQRDVLIAWHGLGYNRRAKALHEAAKHIMSTHRGRVPRHEKELRALPGIGVYTARALCVFAYNQPHVLIETNIRTVLFHCLLTGDCVVPDTELEAHLRILMDVKNPREWYWAMMDYGAHLKRSGVRSNTRHAHYTKQKAFKGSGREVRGAIIAHLVSHPKARESELYASLPFTAERIHTHLHSLKKEGLIQKRGIWWRL